MSFITRTDATAVKLHNRYIIAGIGSNLEIHLDYGSFLQKVSILKGQKIYGIVPFQNGPQFLIFGGKQFTTVTLGEMQNYSDDDVCKRNMEPIICDDWLHSGIWISEEKIALLTAHNVVQVWNVMKQHLEIEYVSKNNSILYSGLLLPLQDDVLVLSGTVFSEVIIQTSSDDKTLHHLKGHKGVIFSITCKPEKNMIVTTCDDRSVRVWSIDNDTNLAHKTKAYWENAKIHCIHELYGHVARVMRNCITDDYVISIGEDSRICFWNHRGEFLKKLESQQHGCLWSMDANDKYLVIGGGDCGVNKYPLSMLTEYSQKDKISDVDTPKKLQFTARRNLIIMTEKNEFIYYILNTKTSVAHELNHTSTYKCLTVSPSKQLIAVSDMNGKLDVFIENSKNDKIMRNVDTTLNLCKILSLHYAGNRHLVVCSDNGVITVLAFKKTVFEVLQTFELPASKERFLTSCAICTHDEILVVSDRCGNVHIYAFGVKDPVKTFNKVHGQYGATSIDIRRNYHYQKIITTGRDGTMKYFLYQPLETGTIIKYMHAKTLDFQWVEKSLSNNENFICGFQERTFMVYWGIKKLNIINVDCGGGHRAWDAIRFYDNVDYEVREFINLIYVKKSAIHLEIFQLNKIVPINIISGSHCKEINCLKIVTCSITSQKFFISGGEDTTLRISCLGYYDEISKFQDLVVFKNLSSVRTLNSYSLDRNKILLISGGGRAQICVKLVTFLLCNSICRSEEIVDYQIKGTDKKRNRNWKNRSIDFDPETRIMDLEIHKVNDISFVVIAGCSDAILRTFDLNIEEGELHMMQEIKYHKTCILKTHLFHVLDKTVLVTSTTRGDVAFWEMDAKLQKPPIFNMKTNKSGINSIDTVTIDHNRFLIATGGDDNAIHINLLSMEETGIELKSSWVSDKFHCSEITGLKLLDGLMISTSVDQRVTLFKWSVEANVNCEYISQHYSDVADIQGLDVMDTCSDSITVCVYGKGLEVISIARPKQQL